MDTGGSKDLRRDPGPVRWTVPAIVAAAGQSTRMGTSKPLLLAGGETFLSRVVTALREGGAEPVLVVLRRLDGPEADEVRSSGGVPLRNPDPSPGPISSLRTGLAHLPSGALGTLFTPVDHPLFQPETVATLVGAFLDSLPPLASPTCSGKAGHPVVFSRAIFPELMEEDLPQGPRTVVQRHRDRRLLVPVEDPGILADIDTPEDYRRHFPLEAFPQE